MTNIIWNGGEDGTTVTQTYEEQWHTSKHSQQGQTMGYHDVHHNKFTPSPIFSQYQHATTLLV